MAPRNYWAPRIPMVPSKGGAPDSSTQSHFLYLLVCYQPPPGKLSCPSRPTPKLSGSPCQLTVFRVEGGWAPPGNAANRSTFVRIRGRCVLVFGNRARVGMDTPNVGPVLGEHQAGISVHVSQDFQGSFLPFAQGGTHVHSPTCIQTCAPHKTATKALCSLACHHCDLSPAFVLE